MEMFNPKGEKQKSDYKTRHPVDGYGKQMMPGYGQEPELEPIRAEKREVGNKRSQLGQAERNN